MALVADAAAKWIKHDLHKGITPIEKVAVGLDIELGRY